MRGLKRTQVSLLVAALLGSGSVYSSELLIDGYQVPEGFETAFSYSQLEVEIVLGKQAIGNATLHIEEDGLQLKNVTKLDLSGIKPEFHPLLKQLLDEKVPKGGFVCTKALSERAGCEPGTKLLALDYDPATLKSMLYVNPQWLIKDKDSKVKRKQLGKSSFDAASGILQQNLNFSSDDSINYNAKTSFAIGEQQFHLSGSAYRSFGQNSSQLESAYWLRDFAGEYLSVGYRSTWDNSEYIGATSAFFPRRDLLGVTYGTSRNTISTNSEESDVPVDLFMPVTGKVEVYRDGRLISTQLLEAGLQRLDTHDFPYGIYDVEVRIYSGEKVVDTQTHTVFKKTNGTGKLEYNLWAGATQESPFYQYEKEDESGLNLGATAKFPLTASLDLEAGGYFLEDSSAVELGLNKYFTSGMNLRGNLLGTHHGSSGVDGRASFDLLGVRNNVSYLWFEAKDDNDRINYRGDTNRLSYSAYYNLTSGQSVSLNLDKDWYSESDRVGVRYSKYFRVGERDSVQLETSLSRNSEKGRDTDTVAFIGLSYSFGSKNLNTTVRGNVYNEGKYLAELSSDYRVSEHGLIRSANGRVSRSNEETSVFAGANFNSQALGGHISAELHSDDYGNHHQSMFGSLQSTVGGNRNGVALVGENSRAGLIIDTNDAGDDNLLSIVNGQRYVMHKGKNFVPLKAYDTNTFYFDVKGRDDQTFKFDENSYTVTAYPGNVGYKKISVAQAVEVVGRLRDKSGQIIPQTLMKNHIGSAVTDTNGMFSAVISREEPSLQISEGAYQCEFDLTESITKQGNKGFVFVGDLVCEPATELAKKDEDRSGEDKV